MFSHWKYLLPFALTGVVCLTSAGSLFAQIRSTTGGATGGVTGGSSLGGGSFGGSSLGGSSLGGGMLGNFGLSSGNFSLGGTSTGSSNSPYGNSPGSSSRGGGGSSSTSYGSTSLIGPYLGEPLAIGVPSTNANGTTQTRTFGAALYNITTSTGSNYGGSNLGGSNFGGGNRTGTNFGNTGTGNINRSISGSSSLFTPNNTFRANAPAYTTRLAFTAGAAPPTAEIRSELLRAIAQSSELPSRGDISVLMDGNTVVLQGKVSTGEERRIVESLMRLTPGVNAVRNELVPLRPGDE